MPTYSNRITSEAFVSFVSLGDEIVSFDTNIGSFAVPNTPLTRKIYVEDDFPYILEFNAYNNILCGITAPDGKILYRISDRQVEITSRSPEYLSILQKDGVPLPLNESIEHMMSIIASVFIERLKNLPQDYLNLYYIYELKVSYLASTTEESPIFDPTPSEKAHALALISTRTSDYPPLVQKTS